MEQRRHQRVRFKIPPLVHLGQNGKHGQGELQNLSLGGLMLRTDVLLTIGEPVGCEFSVFGSPVIDLPIFAVSKIGDVYGARFQAGPLSSLLLQQAIDTAIGAGKASILTINELDGRKVMRITGGLNAALHNDFMHGLTRVGVVEIDLSRVTDVDNGGLALCRIAAEKYEVPIVRRAPCVEAAWARKAVA